MPGLFPDRRKNLYRHPFSMICKQPGKKQHLFLFAWFFSRMTSLHLCLVIFNIISAAGNGFSQAKVTDIAAGEKIDTRNLITRFFSNRYEHNL